MGLQAQWLFSSLCLLGSVHASQPKIAGYEPGSDVTSHNKLDLDQQAIEINLKNDDFTKAKDIYQNGAHSGARSVLTLATPFSVSFLKSAAVVQGNVNGILYSSYGTGVTSMKVTYGLTSAEKCVDSDAAPNNDTTKCFTTNAAVTVAGTNVGFSHKSGEPVSNPCRLFHRSSI
jgi:hypothetical protein